MPVMSVIMSDMKTAIHSRLPQTKNEKQSTGLSGIFTVRDLNRSTQAVLAACKHHGQVTIRSRGGESFIITPTPAKNPRVKAAESFAARQTEFRARLRVLGFIPPSAADAAALTKLIAGDE